MKNWLRTILPHFAIGLVLAGILYPLQHFSLESSQFLSSFSIDKDKPSESLQQSTYYIISASALDRMPWETKALPIEITEEDTSEKDSVRTNLKGSLKRFQSKYCQFLRSFVSPFGKGMAVIPASSRLFVLFEVFRI